MDAAYHDTLARMTAWPLAGSWTLESFLDSWRSFDQWGGEEPEWEMARGRSATGRSSRRRWTWR